MKRIIQISFLTGIVMLLFFATGHSQQRPSQRSFASIMNEVNKERAARDKMLQHMKQTTPPNIVLPSASIQSQPAMSSTVVPTSAQKSLSSPGTNQQPANNQTKPQLEATPTRRQ